ncbi:RIP metalloprotease RseP [Neisseriaceae bacterium JH1-16]|nr:RIP metalloprotease RseP [Neisseriaceae bacterium JH1-16]
MITLLAFIVAIGVLVTIHELGHYTVARWCGVKVLRFSIGFGKPLLTIRRGDTDWTICPIPLGGYVRMLDEREGNVDPAERHLAFNNQSVWKRIAIVVAGPIANLLLAVLLYWVVLIGGVTLVKPWVGTVVPQTLGMQSGFQSGDKLLSVNGVPVFDWQAARMAIVEQLAEDGRARVAVQTASGTRVERRVDLTSSPKEQDDVLSEGNLGLMPQRYLPQIGALEEGGVAEKAGFRVGDKLLSADGKPLSGWESWVELVYNSPGKELKVEVLRDGMPQVLSVRPASVERNGETIGRIGAAPQADTAWNEQLKFEHREGFFAAGRHAFARTWETASLSLKFVGRMITGAASVNHLSGPLTIADVAGQTARVGLTSYLEFLALISISIGVLNLLPIPVLDGGHLMYYVAELIRGRPLSERAQLLGQKVGFALLAMIMAVALLNDFSRLFGG